MICLVPFGNGTDGLYVLSWICRKASRFCKNGGTLVISYWSGLVDETDKCYLEGTPHGLMEAAGIRTEEIDALYDWEENVGIPETGNHLRLTESYTCKISVSLQRFPMRKYCCVMEGISIRGIRY